MYTDCNSECIKVRLKCAVVSHVTSCQAEETTTSIAMTSVSSVACCQDKQVNRCDDQKEEMSQLNSRQRLQSTVAPDSKLSDATMMSEQLKHRVTSSHDRLVTKTKFPRCQLYSLMLMFTLVNIFPLKVTSGHISPLSAATSSQLSSVNRGRVDITSSSATIYSQGVTLGENITIDFSSVRYSEVMKNISTAYTNSGSSISSESTSDRRRRSNLSSMIANQSSNVESSSNSSTFNGTSASAGSSISWTAILQSSAMTDSSKSKNGLASSAYLTPLPLSDLNHHILPTESTVDHAKSHHNDTSHRVDEDTGRPNHQKFLTYQLKRFIDCREMFLVSSTSSPLNYCEGAFDGFNCWLPTESGKSLTLECPSEFYSPLTAVHPEKPVGESVTRRCFSNGSWDEDVTSYYIKYCNFNASVINGDPRDMELLQRLISDVSKLDSSPFNDVRTTLAFEECIDTVLAKPLPSNREAGSYCERTFDGWGCWNDTPANSTAFIPCPTFMPGFLPERMAFKVCLSDGTWFRHPSNNRTWSNYTTCIDQDDLSFRSKINNLYIGGYAISVIALAIALVIFFSFTSLKCDRTTIHKNLFISFIINNIVWIIWYVSVIYQPDVIVSNPFHCQVLHVIVHYFLVCNYFWMFCEGLYLHTLLVIAFVSEERILKWFYVIGWIVPLIFTTAYAVLRSSSPSDTVYCWIEESKYTWILQGPVVISMVLNFFFLVNIVRVLVTKLRETSSISHSSAADSHQIRKAVRATLILIPLLGLQYVLMPFRPPPGSPGENVYEVLAAIFTSLQGLAVALLFCFFNGEVINVLKKCLVDTCSHRISSVNVYASNHTNHTMITSQPVTTNNNNNSADASVPRGASVDIAPGAVAAENNGHAKRGSPAKYSIPGTASTVV